MIVRQLRSMSFFILWNIGVLLASLMVGAGTEPKHEPRPVAQGQIVDEAPESGFYQAPTLLCDVPAGHRLREEEIFAPVLCAMRFQDEDEAVELANATQFGLAAGIWTADGARQFRMAKQWISPLTQFVTSVMVTQFLT